MNQELPNVKAGFRKDRGTNWQWSNYQHLSDNRNSNGIKKKKSTSVSLTMLKALAVWITTNCGKFLKKWKYQTTLLVFWETCNLYAGQEAIVRSRHTTTDRFKIGKGVHQVCIFSFSLFNLYAEYSMWNLGWMIHKLESRLTVEISISITSDMQITPP